MYYTSTFVLHSSTILHKLIFKQEKERKPLFFLQSLSLPLVITLKRYKDHVYHKKATTNDIQLINEMAQIVFPATYREILSKEQLDYMMDWMYSPKNLRKQMEEEGHIYYIAYKDGEAAGYVSIQPEGEHLFHLQKIYVLPLFFKVAGWAKHYLSRPSKQLKKSIPDLAKCI